MINLKTTALSALLTLGLIGVPVMNAEAKKGYGGKSNFTFSSSKSYSKPSWGSKPKSSWGGKAASQKNTQKTAKKSQTWGGRTANSSQSGTGSKIDSTPQKSSTIQTPVRPKPAAAPVDRSPAKTKLTTATSPAKTGWGATSVDNAGDKRKPSQSAQKSLLASKPSAALKTEQQKKAYHSYKNQQNRFKGSPNPAGFMPEKAKKSKLYAKLASSSNRSASDYWDRRKSHYRDWDAPAYVYQGSSSYGMLDGMFLGYMLSNAMTPSYGAFAYHHQNDPGMEAWMNEMENRAEGDAELRAQLNSLKSQMATMKGTPIDPGYVPNGINADMVLAPYVVVSVKPKFRYCTAGKEGNYYLHGLMVRSAAVNDIDVEVVPTSGTLDNLGRMQGGECDGALAQRTGFKAYADENPNGFFNFERIATPGLEYSHMLCSRKSGVDSVKDLAGRTLLVGKKGSGTAQAWEDFVETDSYYQKVNHDHTGGMTALNKLLLGIEDCMMYVASLNTALMKKANLHGDKLVLVPVNDGSFAEGEYGRSIHKLSSLKDQSGEDMYTFADIPGGQYPNIQDGIFFDSVETLSVPMDMVVSLDWSEKNPEAYESLISAILTAQGEFDKAIRPN